MSGTEVRRAARKARMLLRLVMQAPERSVGAVLAITHSRGRCMLHELRRQAPEGSNLGITGLALPGDRAIVALACGRGELPARGWSLAAIWPDDLVADEDREACAGALVALRGEFV